MTATPRRIYLDNAATSWPKPQCVYEAVEHYQRHVGAPVGRSAYQEAAHVERQLQQARVGVAKLLGISQPEEIIFTFNGTDSLNLAIHGLLRSGDHVVTTVCEHNSVLRPLAWQRKHNNVDVSCVGCDTAGRVEAADILASVRPETRLVVITHASNVTGMILPVAQVASRLTDHPALLLVDAAQTLGHVPIDAQALGADLLAASGHKGLLGPLGTGVLYIPAEIKHRLRSWRQGGTGSQSDRDEQPETLPDKYESGNHNAPGLVGLAASTQWLASQGVDQIAARLRRLTDRLLQGLGEIAGVRVVGPGVGEDRTAVVSMVCEAYDPQEVAALLDASARVQVRAGLHCAPRMHQALGTLQRGGTVRFSLGWASSDDDVDQAIEATAAIATS